MIAFPSGSILPFESPWSVFHKLAWFNSCTPARLLELFFDHRPKRLLSFTSPCWRHGLAWTGARGLEPVLDRVGLLDALQARTLGPLSPHQQAAGVGTLRVCPRCIRRGYHSLMHQLPGVPCCPIDLTPLREGCPGCGGPVPYGIEPSAKPFGCESCLGVNSEDDWAPTFNPKFETAEREAGRRICDWYGQTVDIRVRWEPSPLRASRHVPGWIDPCVIASWLLEWTVPSTLPKGVFGSPPVGARAYVYRSPDGSLFRIGSPDIEEESGFQVLMLGEMVESLAREFRRRFCRQHPCLDAVLDNELSRDLARLWCPIGETFSAWLRAARMLAIEVERAAIAARRYSTIAGVLRDITCALKTNLSARLAIATAPRSETPPPLGERDAPLAWQFAQPLLDTDDLPHEGVWLMADVDYSFLVEDLKCQSYVFARHGPRRAKTD